MQVSVEQLEGLERRMTVQVPAETVEQEIRQRLQSLSRRVRLDGFRPGKVPLKVVKRMYGPQVRQEVVGELMERSFRDALDQERLRPAGGPKVDPVNVDEGADLEYKATFEIMPEFAVKGLEGRKIVRPQAEVSEADIDRMLETLRKQRTDWKPVERPAQAGDQVTISFEGKLDGADFPGNKGENTPVVLGEGGMLEDFERQLYGQKAGAELEFDIAFPETYGAENLAGKSARFTVKVHAVAEPELPEIDEDFIKGFGIEDGNIDALRAALRENMERELSEGIQANVKKQVMDALLEENDIPVPQSMVEQEIETLARQSKHSHDHEDEDAAAAHKRLFEPEAQRRVALGLIVARLVSDAGLKPDEQRIQQKLENIAASYHDSAEVIRWYRQNPKLMESIQGMVMEDQIVDWLLKEAEVEDRPASFDELMRPNRADAKASVTTEGETA